MNLRIEKGLDYIFFSGNFKVVFMKRYVRNFLAVFLLFSFSYIYASDNTEEVFTEIYNKNLWHGGSGDGSKIQNSKKYVTFLQHFLKQHKIRSVVDLGCGDWQLHKYIDWSGIQYKGYDVVKHILEASQREFGNDSIQFIHANAIDTDLPTADLLICKDVLQHLPLSDIVRLIPQLKKFKYCLITNDVEPSTLSSNNADMIRGGCRTIDLTKPPFNLSGNKILTFRSFDVIKQTLLINN